jgi:hypothetical protein
MKALVARLPVVALALCATCSPVFASGANYRNFDAAKTFFEGKAVEVAGGITTTIGIPVDIVPDFPAEAKTILLTEAAKDDPAIVDRMTRQLQDGKNVVIK